MTAETTATEWTEADTLEVLTHTPEGREIRQLSLQEIRTLADESVEQGFAEMVAAIVSRLCAMAEEGDAITTAILIAVASAELEI